MTAQQLIIAAHRAGAEDPVMWACQRAIEAEMVERFLTQLSGARVFTARVVEFERVKTEHSPAGKGRLTLDTTDRKGQAETIETDWLNDPMAAEIARVIEANLGARFVLWKVNDEDPTGEVTHGFRRVAWVRLLSNTREKEPAHSASARGVRPPVAERAQQAAERHTRPRQDPYKSQTPDVPATESQQKMLWAIAKSVMTKSPAVTHMGDVFRDNGYVLPEQMTKKQASEAITKLQPLERTGYNPAPLPDEEPF